MQSTDGQNARYQVEQKPKNQEVNNFYKDLIADNLSETKQEDKPIEIEDIKLMSDLDFNPEEFQKDFNGSEKVMGYPSDDSLQMALKMSVIQRFGN